jgi:hypothetical protein
VAVVDAFRIPARGARTPRRSWFARARARRDADRWLRISDGRWESHPAFAWRTAELTSARERRVLARSLHGIVGDVTAPRSPFSASPLNRRGLRPHTAEIKSLADLVGDLDRPVSGAGIVLVRDLLTDGGSPLYTGGNAAALPAVLARIRATLARQQAAEEPSYPEGEMAAGADGNATNADDAVRMRRADHV